MPDINAEASPICKHPEGTLHTVECVTLSEVSLFYRDLPKADELVLLLYIHAVIGQGQASDQRSI